MVFVSEVLFQRSVCFYVTITGDQYFNFETSFLKQTKTFLKKLEYRILVECTTMENATFPFKTALSKMHC